MNAKEFEDGVLGIVRGSKLGLSKFTNPYEAGMHAGRYGSDLANTHFCWFESRASGEEWSRGNAVGIRLRAKATARETGAEHE
jgi:hypothetical protein